MQLSSAMHTRQVIHLMYKQLDKFIDSLDLSVDATHRCDCPVCNGKKTFTVTNESGNILYNCYKNSCKVAGVKHTKMDSFTIQRLLKHRRMSEPFTEAPHEEFVKPPYLTYLTQDDPSVNAFVTKWKLDPDDLLYDIRQSRIVFPVYTENALLVDAVGRSLKGQKPKWLRYAESPVPYAKGSGKVGVVVEDVISAYTVGREFIDATGIALLGTQLTEYHKRYLSKWYDKLIIALDPDALDKTISIAKELRVYVPDVKVMKIKDDLKYMRDEDMQDLEEMLYATTS